MTNIALLAFCPNAHSARIAVGRSTPASLLHGVATARMSTVNAAMDLSAHSRSWLASPTASICSRVKVIFSALQTRRTFFVLAMGHCPFQIREWHRCVNLVERALSGVSHRLAAKGERKNDCGNL